MSDEDNMGGSRSSGDGGAGDRAPEPNPAGASPIAGLTADDGVPSSLQEMMGGAHSRPIATGQRSRRASRPPGSLLRKISSITDFPLVRRDYYSVSREIARGGLGRIVEAQDHRLQRTVVIKELACMDDDARARFVREVLITARLQHPGIVPVHEVGRWSDGKPFYAMKYVEGQPLSDAITQAEDFAARMKLLHHVIDVAEAMAYAHSQSILHRDLKPHNVLVGPFGETVVIDWGLAKDLHDPFDVDPAPQTRAGQQILAGGYTTSTSLIIGTPAYMPPEQARGQEVDMRADVYALGAMLYHLLSGDRPYARVPGEDVLPRLLEGPPLPIAEIAPEASPDLVAIIDKAMARNPANRYANAEEMAGELKRQATGNLVGAHHYSSWELLRRFVRRWRAVLLTAAVAMVAVVTFAAWGFSTIAAERNQARRLAGREAEARARAERSADAAQERVNQFQFERAKAYLSDDPTMAVAYLKKLDPIVDGAVSVAADAMDRGVARRVLRGHTDYVAMAEFSPDGELLATAGADATVILWDPDNGTPNVLRGHRDRVTALAFSPDGKSLVSASDDHTVRIWDVATGTSRTFEGHTGAVKWVAFSPDGAAIASIDDSGLVIARSPTANEDAGAPDGEDGDDDGAKRTLTVPAGREPRLLFSPDSEYVVVAGSDGAIYQWRWRGGGTRTLRGHDGQVAALSLSPDGKYLLSGGHDGAVILWGMADGSRRTIAQHGTQVYAVAISPDSQYAASGDRDGEVRVWARKTGVGSRLGRHNERVTMVTFSNDSEELISTSSDKTARMWVLGAWTGRTLRGHDDAVSWAVVSPDGKTLATASWDKTVRLWSLESRPWQLLHRHEIGATSVAVAQYTRYIASGGLDKTVRVWDRSTQRSRAFTGHGDRIYSVLFSPTGRELASASGDNTVRIWDLATGRSRELIGHEDDVQKLAFSPDGRFLISGSADKTARIWDVATGSSRVLEGHTHTITDVVVEPTGKRVLTASRDGTVRIWEIATGDLVQALRDYQDPVWSLALSPDGTQLVTPTAKSIRLRDMGTSSERSWNEQMPGLRRLVYSPNGAFVAAVGLSDVTWLCEPDKVICHDLVGHRGAVSTAAFSPDSKLLATASADNTARIWDVATYESRPLRGHAATVVAVQFAPEGNALVSAGADGAVFLWSPRAVPTPEVLGQWLSQLTAEVPLE